MRYMKWMGILAAAFLIVCSFIPWARVENLNITITGIDTTGTHYGKPAYLHFVLTFFFLFFTIIQKIWVKRANLLITALNMGWAIRNFFVIPACEAGICPDKKAGLWILLAASLLMLISSLFPDIKPEQKTERP